MASVFHFAITEGIFKILLPKFFKGRRRPYIDYPQEIKAIGREHRDSSFPSSHMSATLAMLTVLVYFFPASWPLAVIATIFMAYARMHHGMHYPSDIMAGIVLGIGYGAGGVYASSIIISFIYS
jgi:undecaprenyl-diphosphatase